MKIAKNIISVLLIIFIIVGIVITVKQGINIGLIYKEREQIGLVLKTKFDTEDIRKIATEVFENKSYIIQKATIFEDTVVIQSEDITDEHIQKIVEKINEKYALEIKAENVEIEKVGAENIKNDLENYILPLVITLALIVVYFGIRFKKLGVVRTIFRFLTTIIFVEALYVSMIGILKIEIGRLLGPIGFMLYMLVVLASVVVFEKERKNLIIEETK